MEYKHKWELDKSSKLIRFYLWVWETDESMINFCKLFWGVLFAPLALLVLKPACWVLVSISDWYNRRSAKRREQRISKSLLEADQEPFGAPAVPPRSPSKVLVAIEHFFLKIGMFFKATARFWRYVSWVVMTAFIVFAVTFVIYEIANHFTDFINGVLWVALMAVCVSIIALFVGLMIVLAERGTFGGPIQRVNRSWFGFWRIMGQGYKAVKTNTCPQVVLTGGETNGRSGSSNAGERPVTG